MSSHDYDPATFSVIERCAGYSCVPLTLAEVVRARTTVGDPTLLVLAPAQYAHLYQDAPPMFWQGYAFEVPGRTMGKVGHMDGCDVVVDSRVPRVNAGWDYVGAIFNAQGDVVGIISAA